MAKKDKNIGGYLILFVFARTVTTYQGCPSLRLKMSEHKNI